MVVVVVVVPEVVVVVAVLVEVVMVLVVVFVVLVLVVLVVVVVVVVVVIVVVASMQSTPVQPSLQTQAPAPFTLVEQTLCALQFGSCARVSEKGNGQRDSFVQCAPNQGEELGYEPSFSHQLSHAPQSPPPLGPGIGSPFTQVGPCKIDLSFAPVFAPFLSSVACNHTASYLGLSYNPPIGRLAQSSIDTPLSLFKALTAVLHWETESVLSHFA